MAAKNSANITFIILHILLGLAMYFIPFMPTIFSLMAFATGLLYIIKNGNNNNEVLYAAAYFVGLEVLLRMTKNIPFYEMGKYVVTIYMLTGIILKGVKKSSLIYMIYILLLIPAIFVSVDNLTHEFNIRKVIAFNLSGPFCIGICALYCMEREITIHNLIRILKVISYPIISIVSYIIIYQPKNLSELITNTASNSSTSGGFGPNQVSTILGLGMFIFFVLILINSKNKRLLILNTALFLIVSFRGIITFSRGGIITGLVMIGTLIIITYFLTNLKGKSKLILLMISGVLLAVGVWSYASMKTSGMIENRYANRDALGREKDSYLTGRETLMATEIEMFLKHPILGVGVGRNKEIREEETGIDLVTHSEVTRLLAEHGMFGLFALLILIYVPLSLYPTNQQNIFLLSFFFFWALTINHAAMRLAAPAFIYALSLLKVTFDESYNTPNNLET